VAEHNIAGMLFQVSNPRQCRCPDKGIRTAIFRMNCKGYSRQISLSYHREMARTHVYLKVELDLPESQKDKERPERVAAEICRVIRRVYGVRNAEVSSIMEKET